MKRSRSITTGINAGRAAALAVLAVGMLLLLATAVHAGGDSASTRQSTQTAVMLTVDGAIGPATRDYITRGLDRAEQRDAALVILRLDTPGGLSSATREIVQAIRGSSVPVATWVAPSGGRAASAGTYILYASHVAAMAPSTNVGAATPVAIGGEGATPAPEAPDKGDQPNAGADADNATDNGEGGDKQPDKSDEPQSAEGKKRLNDAVAWIRSLAGETGRNADWAEQAVRGAASLPAEEAVEQHVADFMAADRQALLAGADDRKVDVDGQTRTLDVQGAEVESLDPDWRTDLLAVITDPTVAYILLMIGIYGLLLEGLNPGTVLPGTVGAIALLLALYALQMLPVNLAGLLLIVLAVILIISEALVPSFGALGFGGLASLVFGSIILMDTGVPGFEIATGAIAAIATVSGLLLLGLAWLAARAWRRPVVSGSEVIEQASGEVIETVDSDGGWVSMMGERWRAYSNTRLMAGTRVRVTQRDGLTVWVAPLDDNESPGG